ncbi:hypothetical protein [Inhella crocodyli]|uniref:Uncharacterized protein n=1 Tax=Inhella crocodyli TaxID=2499851 RepID=A0A3S2UYK6_9BURK|nr:hypothetical protein [Inhella crocodyli]RVT83792.1 hypothetical protein EOD73_14605 [Inhella crocodyli]
MPLPFVEAWKALALRVAERLARPVGPEGPAVQRAKRPPKGSSPAAPNVSHPPAQHRSGRRHG